MRGLRAVMRDLTDSLIDAKAANAAIFFATDVPPPRHDQAGLTDRALRRVQEYAEELDRLVRHDDGSQLRLGAV